MPRKPRQIKRRKPDYEIETHYVFFLSHGREPSQEEIPHDEFSFLSYPGFKHWLICRYKLLREWIKHFPGSRPWAWWQYDSPGLRKQVGGQRLKNMKKEYWQISSKGNTDGFETKIQSSFGIPEILDLDKGKNLIFESQAAFLARYGLLSKSEQKRLKPADFRPELTKK